MVEENDVIISLAWAMLKHATPARETIKRAIKKRRPNIIYYLAC